MSQYVINTGAIPNDGTGDPLRTAFNEVNQNFTQIFTAGPVNSNIQIANNTISTTNTNGNLYFNPNGIGNVIANAHVIPDQTRIRNLGAAALRWNTVYGQYLDIANASFSGNVFVGGNLNVVGNTVTNNYSNLAIANINIVLAANATSAAQANNGGIVLAGANASILYNSSSNAWVSNIALQVQNTVTATQFIGDGGLLSNVTAVANAETLTGTYINANVVDSSLTSVGTLGNLSVSGSIVGNEISGNMYGDGGNLANITGSNVVGNVATAYYANVANLALVSNVAIFANTANDANSAIYSVSAGQANRAFVANTVSTNAQPNITSVGTLSYLSVNGNVWASNTIYSGNTVTGNIYTDNYYYANGAPFGGGGGAGNPAGSNTQVQYNANGIFGATSAFTFNSASNTLSVGNSVNANRLYAVNGVVFNGKTINAGFTLNGFNASSTGPIDTAPGIVIDITNGDWLIS